MGSESKQQEKDATKITSRGRETSESEEEREVISEGRKCIFKTGEKSRGAAGFAEEKKNATLQFGMLVFK